MVETGLGAGDGPQVRVDAHTLKGSCLILGADPSERCARGWRMRSVSFGQLREAVAAHLGNGKRMYA